MGRLKSARVEQDKHEAQEARNKHESKVASLEKCIALSQSMGTEEKVKEFMDELFNLRAEVP